MAYLVLARKWRPQSWNSVIGQNHVTTTLQNAIQHDRLAHAYLFSGPRGVGKTSAARILAKSLNCDKGPAVQPCNSCTNCEEIASGRSVDVFEIDGASNRGIDEVRNLRENSRYAPAHGRYKIYIIDEVHMLTNEAFNALLKTLEEPPDHVLFIFATTEPHRVPATIVSRCQRFDFRRIRTQEMVDHLQEICKAENIQIEEDALALIVKKSDGSLRDSQSLLDQMVSYSNEKITVKTISQALGLLANDVFFDVTDMISEKDTQKALALVDHVVAEGVDLDEFVSGLIEHFRNLLLVSATGNTQAIDTAPVYEKRYIETVQKFKAEDLLRLIRMLSDAAISLKRDINPRVTLEMTLYKMANLDQTVQISDLLRSLAELKGQMPIQSGPIDSRSVQSKPVIQKESKPSEKSTETENSKPEEPPDSTEPVVVLSKPDDSPDPENPEEKQQSPPKRGLIPIESVQAQWDEVIRQVRKKKITIGSFLMEGTPIRVDDHVIEIEFGHASSFHIDAIMRCKKMVLDVLIRTFGEGIDFRCVKGESTKRESSSSSPKDRAENLKALGVANPAVQKLIDDFDVEIVEMKE